MPCTGTVGGLSVLRRSENKRFRVRSRRKLVEMGSGETSSPKTLHNKGLIGLPVLCLVVLLVGVSRETGGGEMRDGHGSGI